MKQLSGAVRLAVKVDKIGLVLEWITGAVCVLCFAVMTAVALLGVFFRYVMQSPFMWTEEVARYLLVWMGFSAISLALRLDKHIKIEVLEKLVPAMVAKAAGYLVDGLVALFMVVLLHQGWKLAAGNMMTASTFHMDMVWILAALPAAAILTLLQLSLKVAVKVIGDVTGAKLPALPRPEPDKGGD